MVGDVVLNGPVAGFGALPSITDALKLITGGSTSAADLEKLRVGLRAEAKSAVMPYMITGIVLGGLGTLLSLIAIVRK